MEIENMGHLCPLPSWPGNGKQALFGKSIKMGGVWFYLAAFKDHETVETEIGKAMQIIADAYANSLAVCDPSQVGSTEAWYEESVKWTAIRWP